MITIFSASADDDLPGTDCVDRSILWTQMDGEKKRWSIFLVWLLHLVSHLSMRWKVNGN